MEADDRTLFIGNIDKNVTEELLYELFLQAGPIERVSIPSSRGDCARYGFVTYKHECSVNYAIELFKGTNLFKKELSIRKRNPKTGSNTQQTNDAKFPVSDSGPGKSALSDFQAQLHHLGNLDCHKAQPLLNFDPNVLKGNWFNRNRPNDFGTKNHFSRPKEVRDRRKKRSYNNNMYNARKNRERH